MPYRVLTIDDDPATTELLTMILKAQNMEVVASNSGAEGIKILHHFNADVVIVDLIMPGFNGWQVFEEIRRFSNVPIIALSSLDDPATIARALDAGADDYIVKPVVSGILMARLRKLARRMLRHTSGLAPLPLVAPTMR